MTFFLQRLVHFHFSFHILSKTKCHSGTSYFIINMYVIIKKMVYMKNYINVIEKVHFKQVQQRQQ